MLNKLTKRLYSEGYTREKHPDFVYCSDFENFGFKFDYLLKTVWVTPCGLLTEGRNISCSDVSYKGVWYCPENNNPVIRCPYSRRDCKHQAGALARYCMCVCSPSDSKYNYDNSVEKLEKEASTKAHAAYMEITGGQYCINIRNSNGYNPGNYEIDFNPERCIQYGCKNEVCSITKQKRKLQKVNIFYDIRREWKTKTGLLEDHKIKIEKGCKVFSKSVALTDAELWLAKRKADYNPFLSKYVIEPHITAEDRRQEYFSKHHRQYNGFDYFEFWYSVENIRIEAREQRDLLQDLKDVAEGLEVVHASDIEKSDAQEKKEAKRKRNADKEKKKDVARLKAFDAHWNDPLWKLSLQNWFGEKLETMIRAKKEEAEGIGEQISFF